MKRRGAAAVIAAAFACANLASPAHAHPGHGAVITVVEGLRPANPAVIVTPVVSVVGKLAISSTTITATVLGETGQPVFRVGPRGVEANAAAPEWYQDNEPLGIAIVPSDATALAPPRWIQVAVASRWEWFDHRLHPASGVASRWTIPLDLDGARSRIVGRSDPATTKLSVDVDPATVPASIEVTPVDTPAPALTFRSDRADRVDVLGPDGELFARLSREPVQVNTHSPLWGPTAQVANRSLLDTVLDASAPPSLRSFSPTAAITWPDPRLLPANGQTEVHWRIPIVASPGAALTYVEGSTVTTPLAESSPAPVRNRDRKRLAVVGAEAVVAAGLLAAALLRRRARRRPRPR